MTIDSNGLSLRISPLDVEDGGNYSCTADNSLGKERGYVDVSGRPHAAKIVSPKKGFFKDQYNLTWTVDSFLPIGPLRHHVAAGRVGALAPRFHGVPTDYSQRLTMEHDAPQIERWMKEDDVDVAILVPL